MDREETKSTRQTVINRYIQETEDGMMHRLINNRNRMEKKKEVEEDKQTERRKKRVNDGETDEQIHTRNKEERIIHAD